MKPLLVVTSSYLGQQLQQTIDTNKLNQLISLAFASVIYSAKKEAEAMGVEQGTNMNQILNKHKFMMMLILLLGHFFMHCFLHTRMGKPYLGRFRYGYIISSTPSFTQFPTLRMFFATPDATRFAFLVNLQCRTKNRNIAFM